MKNTNFSVKNVGSLWRNSIILFVLAVLAVLTFLVTASVFDECYRILHLAVYVTQIGAFIALLIMPLVASVIRKKSFFITVLVLILFNAIGSIFLYFYFRKEMKQ